MHHSFGEDIKVNTILSDLLGILSCHDQNLFTTLQVEGVGIKTSVEDGIVLIICLQNSHIAFSPIIWIQVQTWPSGHYLVARIVISVSALGNPISVYPWHKSIAMIMNSESLTEVLSLEQKFFISLLFCDWHELPEALRASSLSELGGGVDEVLIWLHIVRVHVVVLGIPLSHHFSEIEVLN